VGKSLIFSFFSFFSVQLFQFSAFHLFHIHKLNLFIFFLTLGVMDGHGGKQCADFAVEDLPAKLTVNLRNGQSCPDALFNSFLSTDKVLLT
jgi:hypothetical protein